MYLNKIKIGSLKTLFNILIVGAGFFYFAVLIIILAILDHLEEADSVSYVIAVLVTISFFGLIGTGLLVIALRSKKRLYRSEQYNRIFEEDTDGIIPYEALSSLTGYPIAKVRSDISSMVNHHIFRNIRYDRNCATIIMKIDTGADFLTVTCPTCGADIKMRLNGGARCPHCGTYMRSEA